MLQADDPRTNSDQLRGVAATNALELGVDVGSMDATLHLGFQRSISSLWQQAGRAGRRNHKSLSIYVAWDSPIDQYFLRHPQQLFDMPVEPTILNLANKDIVQPHLLCAANELPLSSSDRSLFQSATVSLPHDLRAARAAAAGAFTAAAPGDQVNREVPAAKAAQAVAEASVLGNVFDCMVAELVDKGHAALGCLQLLDPLSPRPNSGAGEGQQGDGRRWGHCGGAKPQRSVSLRSIDDKRWSLNVPTALGKWQLAEEVEEWMAFYQLYEGATYMNNGRTYIIHTMDFEGRVAFARGPVSVDYYTSVRDMQNVETSAPLLAYPALPSSNPSPRLAASAPEDDDRPPRVSEHGQQPNGSRPALLISESPAAKKGDVARGLIAPPHYGPATVVKSFLGYTKFKRISGKWIDSVDLQMPEVVMHTFATWIPVPEDVQIMFKAQAETWEPAWMPWDEHLRGGLHAASHALINVLPLFARISANDALTTCDYPAARRYRPRYILIGDRCKGGNGLSLQAYRIFRELIVAAIDLIAGCSCTSFRGCPACVQMMSCAEYNIVLDKKAALTILRAMLVSDSAGSTTVSGDRRVDVNSMVLRKQRTLY